MSQERRFAPANVVRLNVEVDARDVVATWTETDEILVRGDEIDTVVEAEELFVTSDSSRRGNAGRIEIELPSQPIRCQFKVERGDIRLMRGQGKLDVDAGSGDVTVSGGSGSLTIASGKGDSLVDGFRGEVVLNSGSGDKTLNQIDGDVTLRSAKGDVQLMGGNGRTTIASASGDVHLGGRDCHELAVAGASGSVTIDGGSLGAGTVSTASGDIRCDAALTIASYDFNASSGDLSLSIPRHLPARVDAATTRGNVTTDLPLVAIAQRGPRNPHGKRLVGSTTDAAERADISLRTSSGDIDIRWSADAAPRAVTITPPQTDRVEEASRVAGVAEPATSSPAATDASDTSLPGQSRYGGQTDQDDRKRAILSALADGAISIEEATYLLDALDRANSAGNGN
jgi:hypothetical protein